MTRLSAMSRLGDLVHFYSLMDELEQKLGGAKKLYDCKQGIDWPVWGIYFFREEGEFRCLTSLATHQLHTTNRKLRITRVGRHNISRYSGSNLWSRLQGHYKGSYRKSFGNHRKSVFRKHVGAALIRRDQLESPSWGKSLANVSDPGQIRRAELPLERDVDSLLGEMEVLWLEVNDMPSYEDFKALCDAIKQHSIALLSNFAKLPLDTPSQEWLGNFNPNYDLRTSGLWNQKYVWSKYDPNFLNTLEGLIAKM